MTIFTVKAIFFKSRDFEKLLISCFICPYWKRKRKMLRKALTNFIWFSQNANVYKNKPNNLCYTLSTHVKLIWKKSNIQCKKRNGFIFCEQIYLTTETNNFLRNQLTCKNVTQSPIDIFQTHSFFYIGLAAYYEVLLMCILFDKLEMKISFYSYKGGRGWSFWQLIRESLPYSC
jgi:hypothetical protein